MPAEPLEDATPHRAATGQVLRRWKLAAAALGAALLVTLVWAAPRSREAPAKAAGQPTVNPDSRAELAAVKAEVAACRQLARVGLGLGGRVVDAAVKHASGHDKARRGTKPIGDPRTMRRGTIWGDEWGPTLPVMHHGGRSAKDAAEAWRRECVK